MEICMNSRQMPSIRGITSEKDYCDLLYAWLQCNSDRAYPGSDDPSRRIHKSKVKWTKIENDFTRVSLEGTVEKVMGRKTIKKYFDYLLDRGLIKFNEEDSYYYLTVLDNHSGHLIEYNTLTKLMNVLRKNSISIYILLFNTYYSRGCQSFDITMSYIKDFIGIATSTTSNNMIIDDTLDILQRLGLLSYKLVFDGEKRHLRINWMKNKLPDLV